jgi:hypothetical protein
VTLEGLRPLIEGEAVSWAALEEACTCIFEALEQVEQLQATLPVPLGELSRRSMQQAALFALEKLASSRRRSSPGCSPLSPSAALPS